ncbi:MAG: TetR/AcrR family transcriptional regulator [Candidatus Devosia phytovorans]|uniref:TetR/AcrR family transcriptional regulator n=1 Tax=Candidatus Devosia phytovorans TaxID=3121372 RepID=A0AAJ5VV71_9HYPH|nr:TetR/AcrR family transcriptional regulator [Devosia sp.]WEK03994.1 MAG: TetR/AcrR family transcriptional regulator [Devosia sp.]
MSDPSSAADAAPPTRKADAPKRQRNAEKTKAAILVAARAEFAARGFEGARVDAIATLAGANKRLLYHYFGNKEDLYRAVLLDAYQEIRRGERALSLDQYGPVDAMDRLVRFTFRHFLANPWFPRLLNTENIENARFLKSLSDIPALHSPLVGQIRTIVERGADAGIFRRDVDPVQLYISIAALGFFYVSNMATLSVIFDRDLSGIDMVQEREAQAVQMVVDYLKTRN